MTQPDHAKPDASDIPLSEEERVDLLKRTEAEIEKIKAEQEAELSKPPPGLNYSNRAHLYGILLITGNVLLLWVALKLSRELNQNLLSLTGYTPGDDPPFYFLQQDMVKGLTLIIPFLLTITLAGAFFRRSPAYAIIVATQSLLFYLPAIATAAFIACHTTYLYDPARATSAWPTLQDYLGDPWGWVIQASCIGFAILMALVPHALKYYKVMDFQPTQD